MSTTIYLCPLTSAPTTIILRDPTMGCQAALVIARFGFTLQGADPIDFLPPGPREPSSPAIDPTVVGPHDVFRQAGPNGAVDEDTLH